MRLDRLLLLLLPGLLSQALALSAVARSAFAEIVADSAGPVRAYLQTHCIECHDADIPAAGLDLTSLSGAIRQPAVYSHWVRIYDRVAKREMPPKEAPQPSDAERSAFATFLNHKLHAASFAKQQRDGRVALRRLNRSEYQNTLHDLLSVTTDVKSLLPEDNTTAGFDKISSGLETSATHLVRYQQAADRALAELLPAEIVLSEPVRWRATGREFFDNLPPFNRNQSQPFVRFEDATAVLCAALDNHDTTHTPRTSVAGRFRIRASVAAVRSDGRPIPVLIARLNMDRFAAEKLEHILDIQDAPADNRRVIEVVANLPKNEQVYLEGLDLPHFGQLAKQRNNEPVADDYTGPGLAVDWIELEGPLDAGVGYRQWFGGLPRVPHPFFDDAVAGKEINPAWMQWHPNEFSKPHNRLRLVSKDPYADAERLLRAFISRAFRKAAPEDVVDAYLRSARELLDRGEPLEEVLAQTYKAVLCSPHFLMLVEKPGTLDDYALASRLSFFLWDSLPDEELLAVAARGELTKSDVLHAQTERLLNDGKVNRFVESFTGQWLELRKMHVMKPDAIYIEYDDKLAWSIPEETRRFFAEVLSRDLPTSSFVDSDWSMLNERLAKHYGISGVAGLDLRRVNLPPEAHRGGVITHASFLKLSTNSTYTSPVKRGVWMLERILGTPPSPPPPNIAAIEPDIRGAVTIREQLAKHQSGAMCASCHAQIDPPGFALENFDVVGGYREFYRAKEPGDDNQYVALANYPNLKMWQAKPVEASGALASGEKFANLEAYRQIILRDRDQLSRNLAEKLLVYSTGAALQFADREAIERIVAGVRAKNHGFRSLLHEVIQSRVFRTK